MPRFSKLKYDGKKGWATIFGRILHGWLNEHLSPGDVDLILPNPTFPRPGEEKTHVPHTQLIITAAARDDAKERWGFDGAPWTLTKTRATPQSANKSFPEKHAAAIEHAGAIEVLPHVAGKRILLFDDLFTSGLQIHHVSKLLQEHGATVVDAVVLARTPWRS